VQEGSPRPFSPQGTQRVGPRRENLFGGNRGPKICHSDPPTGGFRFVPLVLRMTSTCPCLSGSQSPDAFFQSPCFSIRLTSYVLRLFCPSCLQSPVSCRLVYRFTAVLDKSFHQVYKVRKPQGTKRQYGNGDDGESIRSRSRDREGVSQAEKVPGAGCGEDHSGAGSEALYGIR
jgi:hypothetical protein